MELTETRVDLKVHSKVVTQKSSLYATSKSATIDVFIKNKTVTDHNFKIA